MNNVVIVSGGQQRDSAMHIHVSVLPPSLLPSPIFDVMPFPKVLDSGHRLFLWQISCIDFGAWPFAGFFAHMDMRSFCTSCLVEAHGILSQHPNGPTNSSRWRKEVASCGFKKMAKQPKPNHLVPCTYLLSWEGLAGALWPVAWPGSAGQWREQGGQRARRRLMPPTCCGNQRSSQFSSASVPWFHVMLNQGPCMKWSLRAFQNKLL